ncbi:MAG: alpha-mannosidase [Lachnospiraceae bacterium]|nr:alpha-mannosidase [Lachnospiraceae bacterium]
MDPNRELYLVGNAHIDPVWQWQWQEGSMEAKATFRSVLDRMKEYPEFVFVCGASVVYEWVKEFAPEMFEEVKERVREGRFVIVGGWYVQPDCNQPSGEGFVRQGLYAQRFFQENFGVTATIGYNVDSFGHTLGIPQILRKQGMDSYIFMRPSTTEQPNIKRHLFLWRSPDGSTVTASRLPTAYSSKWWWNLKDPETLEKRIQFTEEAADRDLPPMLLFYGVGNHGGGPTKENIEGILALRKKYPDRRIVFSNLRDYFDRVKAYEKDLPVREDDLQHHAPGCYAAVSGIKTAIRRAENEMTAWENYGMLSHFLTGRPAPDPKEVEKAWKNILFAHFHDSMGGCSMKPVHDDTIRFLNESRSTAERAENNDLQSLSWKIDTETGTKGYPLVVFNPHAFEVRDTLCVNSNFPMEHIFDDAGTELPIQHVHTPAALVRLPDYSYDTIFDVTLPPLGYRTYWIDNEPGVPAIPMPILYMKASQRTGPINRTPLKNPDLKAGAFFLENRFLIVHFDRATGEIRSIFDRKSRKQLLKGNGCIPVVIDESDHDTWSHGKNFFDREIGKFVFEKAEVLETGPVRATFKVTSKYGDSRLETYYSLTDQSPYLKIRVKLWWHETMKMLKLRFETSLKAPDAWYEIPFGVIKRQCIGEEDPGQTWVALRDAESGFAMINDSKYSFSAKGSALDLTAIRSPYYQDHGRGTRNEECDVTDQGLHDFTFAVRVLGKEEDWAALTREAKILNLKPRVIEESRHTGTLPTAFSGLSVSSDHVLLSAFKRSEDRTGLILRAYETAGKPAGGTVFGGPLLPVPLKADFTPYSCETYFLKDGEDMWKKVLMTEFEA